MRKLTIAADLLSLRAVGPWVAEALAEIDEPDRAGLQHKMELALQEIGVNVVNHAYGGPSDAGIDLTLDVRDQETIVVTVTDQGAAFDPGDRPRVDLNNPSVGGYGLYLVEKLCKDFVYDRIGEENRWTLCFDRSAQVSA